MRRQILTCQKPCLHNEKRCLFISPWDLISSKREYDEWFYFLLNLKVSSNKFFFFILLQERQVCRLILLAQWEKPKFISPLATTVGSIFLSFQFESINRHYKEQIFSVGYILKCLSYCLYIMRILLILFLCVLGSIIPIDGEADLLLCWVRRQPLHCLFTTS